jgi:hypothetical protein
MNNINLSFYNEISQIATSPNLFLKQIYNLNNYGDVLLFLKNDIINLPIYSQERLLKIIFNVYRDNNNFPDNNYVNCLSNILNNIYNIQINENKIYKKIIKIKNNENINNIIDYFIKKK